MNDDIKKLKEIKGGGDCCDEIKIIIDIGSAFQAILDGIFYPINLLIWLIVNCIRLIINHWNTHIHTLSFILERFINLMIFSMNGYINVISMILYEVKVILKFNLLTLKYNNFVLQAALMSPIMNEIIRYFSDTLTINMFSNAIADDNWSVFDAFWKGVINLAIGRTVKPKCDINDYADKKEMKSYCHEYKLDSCNVNMTKIFTFCYYLGIILYIAAWYAFLKIFYIDSGESNLVDYVFVKLGLIGQDNAVIIRNNQ